MLCDYDDILFPPESAQAFRIAEANVDILSARAYDTNANADNIARSRAEWELRRMRVSRLTL